MQPNLKSGDVLKSFHRTLNSNLSISLKRRVSTVITINTDHRDLLFNTSLFEQCNDTVYFRISRYTKLARISTLKTFSHCLKFLLDFNIKIYNYRALTFFFKEYSRNLLLRLCGLNYFHFNIPMNNFRFHIRKNFAVRKFFV